MAEKKYIEIEAAIEAIKRLYQSVPLVKLNIDKWYEKNKAYMECEIAIESLPAADVREVKRGKWMFNNPLTADFLCDNCLERQIICTPFCPNCGADMSGTDDG